MKPGHVQKNGKAGEDLALAEATADLEAVAIQVDNAIKHINNSLAIVLNRDYSLT